jgi:hypothetical protein
MSANTRDYLGQALQDFKLDRLRLKRKEIEKYLDFYTGTSIGQYIEPYFSGQSFKEVPVYESNITKKFINKLSRIYTLGAKRNVNKNYEDITSSKDVILKHLERMTRLLGTIAVQIGFDEVKGFTYNPIYYFIPYFSDSDPLNPVAIAYPLLPAYDDPSKSKGEERFAYWDDEFYIEHNAEGVIEKEIAHGLGMMPIVFFHREHQIDSFFVEGAMDIVNCNQHLNITLTELQLGLRFQMFGQPWATGVPEAGAMSRGGTDTTIVLPEGANYGIASPGGSVMDTIEAMKFQVELVALANHMYVQFAQDGGETPSGLALQIKDIESYEDMKDDVELWRMYESNIYEIEKAHAKINNLSLPESFGIDFIEMEYPTSIAEQIQRDDWDLKNGQTTLAKIMVRENKDLSLEEAQKIIEENLATNGINALPLEEEKEEAKEEIETEEKE